MPDDNLYRTVGAIIIRWGTIDTLIGETCRYLVAINGPSERRPARHLEQRLKFIEESLDKNPSLAPVDRMLRDVIRVIREIKVCREFIAHGLLRSDKPQYTFVKVDRHGSDYKQTGMTFTLEDLVKLAESFRRIVTVLLKVGEELKRIRKR